MLPDDIDGEKKGSTQSVVLIRAEIVGVHEEVIAEVFLVLWFHSVHLFRLTLNTSLSELSGEYMKFQKNTLYGENSKFCYLREKEEAEKTRRVSNYQLQKW